MKKLSLALMLTGMLFSCKKENAPAGEQVKKPVTIRIPDFTTSHENIRVNADSSLAGITDLYYLSYTITGVKVHEVHQDSTDPNFGTFVDTLVPGHYRIVVIASQKQLVFHTATGDFNSHTIDPGLEAIDTWLPYKDFFYKNLVITVPETGNPGIVDVSLDRTIGKVQVNILDALPVNHMNGLINIKFINPVAKVNMYSGLAHDISWNQTMNMTRVNQHRFEDFMFGIDDSFELWIYYKDKYTGALLVKSVPNIIILPNQKTIVQGYLYGAPNNAGFQIKLNQSWGTDSTVVNFN
jgi:hypothetical protein